MEAETQSPPIAVLSGAAAKLWLYLLTTGGEDEPNAALQRGSGIKDKHTLVGAKRELQLAGVWREGWIFHPNSVRSTCGYSTPQVEKPPLVADGDGVDIPPQGGKTPRQPDEVPEEGEFLGQNDESALTACVEADRLPADGDKLRSTSNYQKRRRAQIQALQHAFADLFDQHLDPSAAKDYLRLAHDSAEVVYEAMEKGAARKPDNPVTYVGGILRREATQPKAVPQAPADEGDIRRPYTQADRERARALAAKLARQGYDTEGAE